MSSSNDMKLFPHAKKHAVIILLVEKANVVKKKKKKSIPSMKNINIVL